MKFKFFRPKPSPAAAASTEGRVVYAIGDIHGYLDLLDDLLDTIARDFASLQRHDRPALVFVGDYVDRGPASCGVIDRLIALTAASAQQGLFEVRALMGNHEQTMLSFLDNPEAGAAWVEFGGVLGGVRGLALGGGHGHRPGPAQRRGAERRHRQGGGGGGHRDGRSAGRLVALAHKGEARRGLDRITARHEGPGFSVCSRGTGQNESNAGELGELFADIHRNIALNDDVTMQL